MARTHFQKLGSWFPRAGKVASFSLLCSSEAQTIDEPVMDTPIYLWAAPYLSEGEGMVEHFNTGDWYPSDGVGAFLVCIISKDEYPNTVGDIMEGYAFYLTDSATGDAPSEDWADYGCFITWSE